MFLGHAIPSSDYNEELKCLPQRSDQPAKLNLNIQVEDSVQSEAEVLLAQALKKVYECNRDTSASSVAQHSPTLAERGNQNFIVGMTNLNFILSMRSVNDLLILQVFPLKVMFLH